MKTNYKYSSTPKSGDMVVIVDAWNANTFNGRTGTILPGKKGSSRFHKYVEVYGMGIHRFYFKSLFKLAL